MVRKHNSVSEVFAAAIIQANKFRKLVPIRVLVSTGAQTNINRIERVPAIKVKHAISLINTICLQLSCKEN